MSQAIWSTIIPSSTSGNQLATLLNGFKDAVVSGFSGTSRPSQLQAGGYWVDTTNDGTGFWDYKLYDGTQDILIFTVNKNNGTASIAGSASVFEILKTSADSVGPILKFLKERIAGNGQVLTNDIIGENRYSGTQDDGNETVQAKMRVISRDNVTSTAQGSSFIWEAIVQGTSALAEMMRLQDGKLGIGTTAPTNTLHLVGTGIKSDKFSDDTVGSKITLKKKRIASLGGVLSGDYVGEILFYSHADDNTDIPASSILVSANENHTNTAQGTKVVIQNKNKLSTTLVDKIVIEDFITHSVGFVNSFLSLNNGLNQANANSTAAGLKIIMSDATTAQISYDSTLASKFKLGETGTLKEIVDVSSTQSLSNKSIVSPSRLDVKKDTEANLTTYAATATDGQWCFATDTQTMYQVVSNSLVPAGSGGGGSSLSWEKVGDNSPSSLQVDGMVLEEFNSSETQEVFATFLVPSSYRAGKQIKLSSASFFCSATTGNVFFKTTTTLLKSGSSVLGTYPNTQNSANSQVVVPGTTNQLKDIGDLALTSSIGEINSVAVAPGDKLRIRLYRDVASETSPAASTAKILLTAIEVKLS